MRRGLIFSMMLGLLGCESVPEGPLCDAAHLASALGSAGAGDVVEVGACTVAVSLRVPAGVVLAGSSPASTLSGADPSAPIVTLETSGGSSPATLRGLTLEVDADVGVRITGDGGALIEDVSGTAERGIAIYATDVGSVTLTRVTLNGPVTIDNSFDERFTDSGGGPPPFTDVATHGVAIFGATEVTLSDVDLRGFAAFGAVFVRVATASWSGGGVYETLGTGVFAFDSNLVLESMEVCDTMRASRLFDAYGVMVLEGETDGFTVETDAAFVHRTEGIGVATQGIDSVHTGFVGTDNSFGAIAVDGGRSFELTGTDSQLMGNGLAGVLVTGLRDVIVSGARIEGTVGRMIGTSPQPIGDGIQLNDSTRNIVIDGVTLVDNARVGLLADLGPTNAEGMTFTSVSIERQTGMLGAQAARPNMGMEDVVDTIMLAGWDDGISRDADTLGADMSFTGMLGTGASLLSDVDGVAIAAGMGLPL